MSRLFYCRPEKICLNKNGRNIHPVNWDLILFLICDTYNNKPYSPETKKPI